MTRINPDSGKKIIEIDDLVYEESLPVKLPKKDNNSSFGLIGAVFGSLIGVIIIILLDKIVYLSSISGIFMSICVLGLYYKVSGFFDNKAFIISLIVIFIMTVFAKNIAYSLKILNDVQGSFSHTFFNIYSYMDQGLISFSSYFCNLSFTLFFAFMGSFGLVYALNIDLKK